MNRATIATLFAALCTAAVIAVVLGVRWFGPHDLYEKDQPKTMAYTADVVLNARFALPRDVIYQPATKPPLYNWVGAAAVVVTRSWSEWVLKFPSVLGTLATGGLVYAMARRNNRDTQATIVALVAVAIWFTFGSNIRHGSVLRMSYLARPDMLLGAFVTAAWAWFTLAVERPTARAAWKTAVLGWLCVAAAALTKGPAALMPAAFAVLYPLFYRRPGERLRARYARLWLPVGVPLVVVLVGAWLLLAMRQDAVHVKTVIWGAELAGRVVDQSPEGFRKPFYYSAMWLVTKAQPWGAIAVLSLLATIVVPRLRRAAGPAALYLAIVLIGLSLPAGKRMDYLLPAYAPAAVLIAVVVADVVRHRVLGVAVLVFFVWSVAQTALDGGIGRGDLVGLAGLVAIAGVCLLVESRRAVPLAMLSVVPLLLAATLGRAYVLKFHEAQEHWSDRAVHFTAAVRNIVGDAPLRVIVRGKHPLTTLLGRHPGSYVTRRDLESTDYVILPVQPDLKPELLSAPLPLGFETLETRELSVLGLYRHVPVDRLVTLQKQVGMWTYDENPYHAPGTVYRDE